MKLGMKSVKLHQGKIKKVHSDYKKEGLKLIQEFITKLIVSNFNIHKYTNFKIKKYISIQDL